MTHVPFPQIGAPSESAKILMDQIKEDYILTGEATMMFDTIDAFGASLFDYKEGADHSWLAFVADLYEDTVTLQTQVLDNMFEAGMKYNPAFRDAQGRNEMMIMVQHFGFGGLRKGLEGGLQPDLTVTDKSGMDARGHVAECAGPRGVSLVEEYDRYRKEQRATNVVSISAAAAVGTVTTALTRHPSIGIFTAAATGIGVKTLGDKVNDYVHDRNVDVIINPAKHKGLKAEL